MTRENKVINALRVGFLLLAVWLSGIFFAFFGIKNAIDRNTEAQEKQIDFAPYLIVTKWDYKLVGEDSFGYKFERVIR